MTRKRCADGHCQRCLATCPVGGGCKLCCPHGTHAKRSTAQPPHPRAQVSTAAVDAFTAAYVGLRTKFHERELKQQAAAQTLT